MKQWYCVKNVESEIHGKNFEACINDFNIFLDTVNAEEDVLMKATKLLLLVLQYGLSPRC